MPWRALLAILAMLHGSSSFEARVDYFLEIFFFRESSDSCGYFMSYKVSAIIIPFCRNLLSPAMVAAFFVTSDDGLPGSCYKRAKKAMVASNWSQEDIGRLFFH